MCLLLIESAPALRESLADDLRRRGHEVEAVADVDSALLAARRRDHDVILFDVEPSGPDWLGSLRRLLAGAAASRVLLLTPGHSVADRVRGLNSGADDCLPKPLCFEELCARVRTLVRSRRRTKSSAIRVGDLVIDTEGRRVTRSGIGVRLTQREFSVLEYLARRTGRTVSQAELEEHLYGAGAYPMSNVVASTVCLLRKKLGEASDRLLHTRRGRGYWLGVNEA